MSTEESVTKEFPTVPPKSETVEKFGRQSSRSRKRKKDETSKTKSIALPTESSSTIPPTVEVKKGSARGKQSSEKKSKTLSAAVGTESATLDTTTTTTMAASTDTISKDTRKSSDSKSLKLDQTAVLSAASTQISVLEGVEESSDDDEEEDDGDGSKNSLSCQKQKTGEDETILNTARPYESRRKKPVGSAETRSAAKSSATKSGPAPRRKRVVVKHSPSPKPAAAAQSLKPKSERVALYGDYVDMPADLDDEVDDRLQTVDDYLAAFGRFGGFHKRLMFVCGLLWGISNMHDQLLRIVLAPPSEFSFVDCHGETQQARGIMASMKERGEGSQSPLTQSEVVSMNFYGVLVGFAIVVVLLEKVDRKYQALLGSCIMTLAYPLLLFHTTYSALTGLLLRSTGFTIVRFSLFIYIVECLPVKLRPVGLSVFAFVNAIFECVTTLIFRYAHDLSEAFIILPVLQAVGTIVFFIFVPRSIRMCVLNHDPLRLKNFLKAYGHKNASAQVNVNRVLDTVAYEGPVCLWSLETFTNIIFARPFVVKLLILALAWSSCSLLRAELLDYGAKRMRLRFFERQIYGQSGEVLGALVFPIILNRFGRRFSAMLTIVTMTGMTLVLVTLLLVEFDFCIGFERSNIPAVMQTVLLFVGMVIYKFGATTFTLMIIEHCPTSAVGIFYPIANLIVRSITRTANDKNMDDIFETFVPEPSLFILLLLCLVCSLLCAYIDNTTHMVISQYAMPCYRRKRKTEVETIKWNDNYDQYESASLSEPNSLNLEASMANPQCLISPSMLPSPDDMANTWTGGFSPLGTRGTNEDLTTLSPDGKTKTTRKLTNTSEEMTKSPLARSPITTPRAQSPATSVEEMKTPAGKRSVTVPKTTALSRGRRSLAAKSQPSRTAVGGGGKRSVTVKPTPPAKSPAAGAGKRNAKSPLTSNPNAAAQPKSSPASRAVASPPEAVSPDRSTR